VFKNIEKINKESKKMKNSKSDGELLKPDFNLNEFTFSQSLERFGYNNTPDSQVISNLKELFVYVLQPFREILHVPVIISFSYCCPSVNTVIGDFYHFRHLEGKAADFLTPSCQLSDSFYIILKNLPFEQLIFEFGRWIQRNKMFI